MKTAAPPLETESLPIKLGQSTRGISVATRTARPARVGVEIDQKMWADPRYKTASPEVE